MDSNDLAKRFKDVAVALFIELRKIKFPSDHYDIKRQLSRASASAAANYRSACRGKSTPDFLNKLKVVEEETDEVLFWLDFLNSVGYEDLSYSRFNKEYDELLRIIVASIKTIKAKQNRKS